MEARAALDELNAIITKLDAFSSLRDILEVAASSEATVKDQQATLASLQADCDAAKLMSANLLKEIEKRRAGFESELDARVEAETAKLDARTAAVADAESKSASKLASLQQHIDAATANLTQFTVDAHAQQDALTTQTTALQQEHDALVAKHAAFLKSIGA